MQESNLVLYSLHEMLSVRYVIELHYKAMLQGDSLLLYNIRIVKKKHIGYIMFRIMLYNISSGLT